MEAVILQEDFKRLVNEQLAEQKITRADLARRMNKPPQFVTNYLNGDTSPGPDVIEKFFSALGCSVRLSVRRVEAASRSRRSATSAT
jgi:transcriptional regulator with XRE-family HTH domain